MPKAKVATVWLDGCSGCHMSFLDIDELLLDLADKIELVYSPLVDNKTFPDMVDVTIVEGAVSNEDDLHKIQHVRAHTRVLIALGDCAVTGNVPAMRNMFALDKIYNRAYTENATEKVGTPTSLVPPLLTKVRPVHQVVNVDVYVPGCPPPAGLIGQVILDVLAGNIPDVRAKFG
jgi:NAD-reducing hydrogenase small subunit